MSLPPRTVRRRRMAAVIALAVVVAAGLVVHRLAPSSVATDVAGDALYAVAVYTGLVMLFASARPALLGALAVAWCVAVELFQLTGAPVALAAAFPPAALVLGTGFDARDLVVYPLAVVVAAAVDTTVERRRGMTAGERGLESA
ncbi:DUF2809 domain-containing protein [Microbacterium hatanonis]|uniref:DUF2809 domain-containing protein n=1 Tax=Microbacterium hatanonis TaxID=404366 RepID=A0A5C8I114_9MICO|nr:DUF2809 domain-containing protein [Microbacterium hatanonis]TXK12672.1 DUF2809 domain-containing protein [Microbacterium hatanonis]